MNVKNVGGDEVGTFVRKYPNGQLRCISNYRNAIQEGLQEGWHENGKLQYRVNYIAGWKKNGLQEYWFENGQWRLKLNYKDDKEEGLQEEWWENGKQQYRKNYKDGTEEGLQEYWYENGQIKHIENYKSGRKDGVQEYYNTEGSLTEEYYLNSNKMTREQFKSHLVQLGKVVAHAMNLDEQALGLIIARLSI